MLEKGNSNLLLIFIKNPEKGKVKTRLAESVGDEKALRVYRELLEITKSITDQLDCDRQVWYSWFVDDEDQWPADDYAKKLQVGDDLGDRMKNAFREGFEAGYTNAVVIGSDCAELNADIIRDAFDALSENEIVIGPSKDGGYYLLGMRSFLPELFEEKKWSTSSVLNHTVEQAKAMNLSYKLLPELNDIDTKEDLDKMAK